MKKLLVAIIVLISFNVQAQYDSTKILQTQNSYGYQFKNGKYLNSLIIPGDTVKMAVKDSNAIVSKGAGLYRWNGYRWLAITGSGGSIPTDTQYLRRDININTSQGIANAAAIQQKADSSRNNAGTLELRIGNIFKPQFVLPTGNVGTLTNFSAGSLSPLFTTSIATSTSTPVLSFSLTNTAPYTLFGRASGTGAPSYLTSIDSNYIPALHSENYYNTKYAAFGGGGGGVSGSGVANRIPFWTGTGTLGSDTSFRYNPTGLTTTPANRTGFTIGGTVSAGAVNDTITAVTINTKLNANGNVQVVGKTFKIGNQYMNIAENYSFSAGSGENGAGDNTISIGFQSNGFGTGSNVIALGQRAMYQTYAPNQIGIGESAGNGANAARLIAIGKQAAFNNSNAVDAILIGTTAQGNAANQISIGQRAGASSAGENSIFLGTSSGENCTSANSVFIGNGGIGYVSTGAKNIFIGSGIGRGDYGPQVTGANNIVFGDAITTPFGASTNTLNIGGVLYGANLHNASSGYGTTAQVNGQIGINIATPDASAVLDVVSTSKGFLTPRMTTTQRDAITTPAEGLEIYNLTSHAKEFFNGTIWKSIITN